MASVNNIVYRLCRIIDIINDICSIRNSTCGFGKFSDACYKWDEVDHITDQSGPGPGIRRILDDIRNTEAQRNDIKNRIPELAIGIGAVYRIISAVGEGVVAKVALAGRGLAVRIDEAADLRVVIPGLEIVESCLGIVVIAAILQGIDRSHFAGCGSGFIRDHHSIVHRASQIHWTLRAYKTVHVQQKSRRS